jgi:hypothetical protein
MVKTLIMLTFTDVLELREQERYEEILYWIQLVSKPDTFGTGAHYHTHP